MKTETVRKLLKTDVDTVEGVKNWFKAFNDAEIGFHPEESFRYHTEPALCVYSPELDRLMLKASITASAAGLDLCDIALAAWKA